MIAPRQQRQRILKGGKIVFNDARSIIDCTVRNISAGGAFLLVESTAGIPVTFDLSIANEKPKRCRIVWKSPGRLGVAFATA